MSLPVIILGGGGHAKVLIDTLLSRSIEIIGITVPDIPQKEEYIQNIKVIGNDVEIFNYQSDKVLLVNGLGTVKSTDNRMGLFNKFKNKGYSFTKVIHPSVIIGLDVQLAEGVQVMAGAIIQTGSIVGMNSIVNTRSSIDHDCIIGKHVHIAPGVTLSGGIYVEDGVHIGTGASIIQGVKIGRNSLIAAGAVVTKDVRDGSTVAGVPAREV